MSVFEQYPVGSWKPDGGAAVKFAVVDVSEDGGHRLVRRERPYRDGIRADNTGRKEKVWNVETVWENSVEEPGIGDVVLYPDLLERFLDAIDEGTTGDLVLPTRGKIRAKVETYRRRETHSERDGARISVTWVEDNEDSVDAQSFELPTVNASAKRVTEEAKFDAQSQGAWDGSLLELVEFARQLENLANAPGNTLRDLETQATVVAGSVNRVVRAFSQQQRRGENNRDVLRDAESSRFNAKLVQLKDLAGRARGVGKERSDRPKAVRAERDTSLFDLAIDHGTTASKMIDFNPSLDPFDVPAGTVVRIPPA